MRKVYGVNDEITQRTKMMWLQMTQHTSSGAVTAVTNCCANCVEASRPQQWGPDLPVFFGKLAMQTQWMANALLIKAGDVETNPGPTNKSGFAISAINKYTL